MKVPNGLELCTPGGISLSRLQNEGSQLEDILEEIQAKSIKATE